MKSVFEKSESELYSELRTISNTKMTALQALLERSEEAHSKGHFEMAIVLSNIYDELAGYLSGRRMLCRQALSQHEREE